MTTSELLFNITVWGAELLVLVGLYFQGQKMLAMEKERLEIERKSFKMASERYDERARWREQKRKQSERKTVATSETPVGSVSSDGSNVAADIRLSEGALRDLPQANEETKL